MDDVARERRVIDMALRYAIDNRDKNGIRDVIRHVKYRMRGINEPENDKE